MNNRWVDVYETKETKRRLFFRNLRNQSVYLMNWQDNVNNLFTLVHEFGHSVHSYYTRNISLTRTVTTAFRSRSCFYDE
ncbi:M3 family metallopeptidase [Bacillus licheniformis]|nr:M3 family metallopeptidase [Bacillus licheniformis]